ncbi:MAG TPA: amidase, partial [Nitrospiria bacterium]|nr:amidase [Nitrospiria bacterium]
MTDFYRLTIHEVHEKLRARKVSSQELVQSLYKRIEEVDPKIRAYLTLTKDLAFAQAKAADTQFEGRRSTHPLTGIPLAIKDNICVKGVKTTCASKILADFESLYDATVIGGLGAAGYVLLGKSNMDEFAMGSSTENSALALTRNPWNLEHIPGGSSGGSAAAVAADECIAALGSDTGGSIRQP